MTPERWAEVRATLDAVLALPAEKRDANLARVAGGDADLAAEVRSLLAAHHAAQSGFLNTPPFAAAGRPQATGRSFRGRRIGPYELVDDIGHGGMGDVYRARRVDGQYTHDVAIKLMRDGVGAPLLIERFRTERQILASLAHDNIARLLDGGSTDDGFPYLVMEWVVGVPVDEYCDAHRLPVSARLRLFEQVCGAVAYAHQRLVIHRDIKPGNILVTEGGVPKLLDFGIAKILDAPGGAETTLWRAMTPEFASPEQLRGAPVTTATDVYSLGVVLYRLLTGRSPYDARGRPLQDLARAITDTDPVPPSAAVARLVNAAADGGDAATATQRLAEVREGTTARLRRRLRGDVDDIVLKALRKEPDRRYASVDQLAEDVRRHLAGMPVLATRGSRRYRAGKFLLRHRTFVVAGGLILVAVLGGALAALHEARIAVANARRAEARFNDVRKLANSLIFEVHDAIEPLPGATPVRELIVTRALEYLDGLSREAGGDAALRRELAVAYEKVAAVQGAPNRDNLGNSRGALDSYRKAVAIREELARAAPADEAAQVDLARDSGDVGELLRTMGDLGGALESYRKALATLSAIERPSRNTRVELQTIQMRYGVALSRSGRLQEAADTLQRAVAMGEALVQEDSSDPKVRISGATAHKDLGDALTRMSRLQDALSAFRRGRALLEPLAASGQPQWRHDVGVLEESLADVLERLRKLDESLILRRKGLASDLETARADPANARARRDVYIDYYKLARTENLAGDTAGALADQHRSLELIEKELIADPANAVTRDDAEIGYFYLGEILQNVGQVREALQAYLRSQQVTGEMLNARPMDLAIRADYAEGQRRVADMQLAVGDRAAALAAYRDSVARFEDLVARNPANSVWRSALATSYAHLGQLFVTAAKARPATQPDRAEAGQWLEKSLSIWNDLRSKGELVPEDETEARTAHAQLARVRAGLAGSHAKVAARP